MEPRGLSEAASAPEEDDQMVTCELEAAEALAGLARCSAVRGDASGSAELQIPFQKLVKEPTVTPSRRPCQDQAISVNQFHGNAYTIVTSALKIEETGRNVPSQLCSTSYQSNSASNLSQNLTEAEKEARRLRRVLANRESARQTIRRRHAMHLDLTRKAADLLEENENLKKEKELAVKEFNSLKGRNEFLKLQMANVKKAESGEMQEEPKLSQAEIASSASTCSPFFLYNQPSLVPSFWPSIVPSSHVFQLQYASPSDVMSSSQFLMRQRDIPSLHLGQETTLGITGPGNPLFVLPVPCLLPFLSHSATLHSYSGTNKRQKEISSAHQCGMSLSSDTLFVKDNHQLSSNPNMRMEASNSTRSMSVGSVDGAGFTFPADSGDHYKGHNPKVTLLVPETLRSVRSVESIRPTRNSQEDDIYDLNVVSAPEYISQGLLKKNQEPIICGHKKSTKARRRRKELMKLKNNHWHHVRTHIPNY
ncbi:hypothetical protein Pfo_004146 [Paulownia fortunei]|nr:hypothetical protein Pfo_004146 [Paulownia fortunei]